MNSTVLIGESLWLGPVWFISTGALFGLILVALFVLLVFGLSRVPGLNSIFTNRNAFSLVVGILTIAISAGMSWALYSLLKDDQTFGGNSSEVFSALALSLLLVIPLSYCISVGLIGLVSIDRTQEMLGSLSEGFLFWCNIVFGSLAGFSILGILLGFAIGLGIGTIVDEPIEKLGALNRYFATGHHQTEFVVEFDPNENTVQRIPISFEAAELRRMTFVSDQNVRFSIHDLTKDVRLDRTIPVDPIANSDKVIGIIKRPGMVEGPIIDEDGRVEYLYVRNEGTADAKVKVEWWTAPVVEQVWIIPWSAVFVLVIYAGYLGLVAGFPKVSAVSISTVKTELSQPIFQVLLIIGIIFVVASIYIPYNTFGEDNKMYKDSAITLIRVLAIFMAVWAASKSVAEEIDGRTALTVLSKPIGRRQFIVGKFAGISLAVSVLVLILGAWLVIWTAYKPIYDGIEQTDQVTDSMICFAEAVGIVPGLLLAAMEVTVFVALAIAISTRVGILANFLICFAIYVLGHLTPLIVNSSLGEFEPVAVTGQIIGTIFPVLDHFDVSAAINSDTIVPVSLLWMAAVYCTIYGACSLLLAFIMFEDRDLA